MQRHTAKFYSLSPTVYKWQCAAGPPRMAYSRHCATAAHGDVNNLMKWLQLAIKSARQQSVKWSGTLSVPQHVVWTRALANPTIMSPYIMSGGLFGLVSRANALTREARSFIQRQPISRTQLPSLAQIDAHLRRCMGSAFQTYSASAPHAQVVLLNALQLCGKNVPYMMGIVVADTIQRSRGFCEAPPLVSPSIYGETPAVTTVKRVGILQRVLEVGSSCFHNAADMFHVLRVLFLFTPVLLMSPLAFYMHWGRHEWMELLRSTIEIAGPAFIKWGQWAATRRDMFPPDMCDELAKLQCSAPSHSWKFTKKAIEDSLGKRLEDLVDWIDEKPVASGSIGQVHRAVLSEEAAKACRMPKGTVVAIKVKHPGIAKSIERDFSIMIWIANQLEWFPAFKKLHISESLVQFAAPLREQVDLLLEGKTLWQFGKNFSHDDLVTLPVPLYPWVSQDVLMQTFEEGVHISTYMELDDDESRRAAVADIGCHCMLNMMLVHNLIHSDLHPGNILVRWRLEDSWLMNVLVSAVKVLSVNPEKVFERWLKPQVVLLDTGMATALTGDDRNNMLALFQGFANMDGASMAEATLKFAGTAQRCINPDGFVQAIQSSMDALRGKSWADTGFASPAAAFASVLDIVRDHEVTLPGHICAVLMTVLVLEGWSSALKPDHSVLNEVKNIVSDDSPSLYKRLCMVLDKWVHDFNVAFQPVGW